jgi:chromosome segregation ATPase
MTTFTREVRIFYAPDGTVRGGEVRRATMVPIGGGVREIEHDPEPLAGALQGGADLGAALSPIQTDALAGADALRSELDAAMTRIAGLESRLSDAAEARSAALADLADRAAALIRQADALAHQAETVASLRARLSETTDALRVAQASMMDSAAAAERIAAAEQLAAQRLTDAEDAKDELGTAMETITQLRAGLAESQAEVARLRAPKADSVGPA